jgi:hypothetical protein
VYGVAYADGSRVADDGFPGRACGDVLALHFVFFQATSTALPHPGGRPQGSPLRIFRLAFPRVTATNHSIGVPEGHHNGSSNWRSQGLPQRIIRLALPRSITRRFGLARVLF